MLPRKKKKKKKTAGPTPSPRPPPFLVSAPCTLTHDLPGAELLRGRLSRHDKRVGFQQLVTLEAFVHELQANDRDAPLLCHAAFVRVLRLLRIIYYQVSGLKMTPLVKITGKSFVFPSLDFDPYTQVCSFLS